MTVHPRFLLPAQIAPSKAREATARRTRKRRLSKDRIVEAATSLLAQQGYDAFSMRALAHVLEVEVASLYYHVASRQALAGLVLDHLMGDRSFAAPSGDWRADLEALATQLHADLARTPGLTALFCEAHGASDKAARRAAVAVGILEGAGFTSEQAGCVYQAMLAFVVGWLQSPSLTSLSVGAAGLGSAAGGQTSAPNAFRSALRFFIAGFPGVGVDEGGASFLFRDDDEVAGPVR